MASEENNMTVEEGISLSEYLIPDYPEILEIESLEFKEPEYMMYLGAVEYSIALYYYAGGSKTKDKDVILALENIKRNYESDLSFFSRDLEILIIDYLIGSLREEPITHHEFRLVIDYVLWSIENRIWMEDEQAYVKWIAYVMGLYSETEAIKYEKDFKKLARKHGMSDEDIELLLLNSPKENFPEALGIGVFSGEDTGKSKQEIDFDLMSDEEKCNFLLEKGPEFSTLLEYYIYELAQNQEFEKIKEFYSKLSEKHPDFTYLHFFMGVIYSSIDPAMAKSCFEKALESAERDGAVPETILESLRMNISMLEKQLSEQIEEAKDKN